MKKEAWVTVAMPIVLSNKNVLEANIVEEKLPLKGNLGVVQSYVEIKLDKPFIRFVCPGPEAEQEVLNFFRDEVIGGKGPMYLSILEGGKDAEDNTES